jgi:hypothetical protein
VRPADVQLAEQIQLATRGGARLLCTLARRGKSIEQREPARAEFLLLNVRTHPLYRGGRLGFDMLEIEDLILDGSSLSSLSSAELDEMRSAGLHSLLSTLREFGLASHLARLPAEAFDGQATTANSSDGNGAPPLTHGLPRISFGVTDPPIMSQPTNGEVPADADEPELTSADYLYDYVVLGLLDMVDSGSR